MALNRDKLLSHIRQQDERQVLVKVLDKADLVLRRNTVENTDFLDPYHLELAKGILRGLDLSWFDWGGFCHAERAKIVMGPSFKELGWEDVDITVLALNGNTEFHTLTHRDYLGALLGLGIRREKLGDIVVNSDVAWIAIDRGMAGYVRENLHQVGKAAVQVSEVQPAELREKEENFKEIRTTVPSLRLDAVAGEGYGLSRNKIADVIKAGKVKVNWRPVEQVSYGVKAGDVISCRGFGRLIVAEIFGETKKGRIALLLKRLT